MNTSLMTNGLGHLELSGAITESVGGTGSLVATACDNLNQYAASLDSFPDELTEMTNRILDGWEGQAADMLRDNFPNLIEAFTEVPPSIRSIADWASSAMSNYVLVDNQGAEMLNDIMGR